MRTPPTARIPVMDTDNQWLIVTAYKGTDRINRRLGFLTARADGTFTIKTRYAAASEHDGRGNRVFATEAAAIRRLAELSAA